MDRMDLCIVMHPPSTNKQGASALTHTRIRESIKETWELQLNRGYQSPDLKSQLETLNESESKWIEDLMEKENLSYRSAHKILRVGRTIADLNKETNIQLTHLREARSYKCVDSYNQPITF